MALKIATVAFASICLFFSALGEPEEPSKACLGCICDAASGCNTTIGCTGDVCGPFRITQAYWTDGGKPKLNETSGDNDYSDCANEALCAGRAVQGYMKKYAQDCNGDGAINCDDYARIHSLGPNSCKEQMNSQIESDYSLCRKVFPQ